jgi:acetylornithine deacetylase/succinyl-diaminopimelate desuccinylase-like protein
VPERANLVARIPGRGGGASLILLSHTDTVLADPAEWELDPWSGELRDGVVWGRGALDMKGQVAASAVAMASLARDGFEPAGDLIFAATADEEVGVDYGLSWLCREHPGAVRADYALNEGAGERYVFGGKSFYTCAAAEKMSAPFRLHVRGRSGHASMPAIADNALIKAARLIERLAELEFEPQLGPETGPLVAAITGDDSVAPRDAVARLAVVDPLAVELVQPTLSITLSPTMIEASKKRNVIPASCVVTVDRRLLPGQTPEEGEALVREALGPGDYEYELVEAQGGTRSALDTPLLEAVESFVAEIEPAAQVVPMCVPGFTDSHWVRDAFGTVAYGFFPARALDAETSARLVHSANERVPVDDLELGVRFFRHAAERVCGGAPG